MTLDQADRKARRQAIKEVETEIAGRIPAELRKVDQWLVWRCEDDEDDEDDEVRTYKVPYDPDTEVKTPTGDYHKWPFWNDSCSTSSFKKAVRVARRGGYDGVGFFFDPGGPYVGVDMDGVVNEDGSIIPKARAVVEALDSYTEISPSGSGLHIVLRARLPSYVLRGELLDIVCAGDWYLAMTGDHLEGTRTTVEDRHEQMERLCTEMIAKGTLRVGRVLWSEAE